MKVQIKEIELHNAVIANLEFVLLLTQTMDFGT
jgi:hypothetical protein